jgi:transposase
LQLSIIHNYPLKSQMIVKINMDGDSGVAGYRVYRHELDEEGKTLKLWVRRKPVHRGFECSGCGRRLHHVHDVREREIRDLPWSVYRATVVVEVHRLRCPDCGVRVEKIEQLPSKAPFSKRFEEIVGEACESAAASQVARRFHLPETTVRAIDLRYLERWDQGRRKPALKQMGVDEIYRGKNDKFLTVVSNLETGEPLWFGKERKKETLDEYFRTQLSRGQRKRIEAACVDMWEPFRLSMEEWVPQVPHRIRQVPHHPARQRRGGRSAAGRVLPQRAEDARCHQRERSGCC